MSCPISSLRGQGGDGSTIFFNIHLHKTAFVFNDIGYGSALVWMLLAITLLLFSARYWVYYVSGETF